LGLDDTVVERVEFDELAQVVVAHVRPGRGQRARCGARARVMTLVRVGGGGERWIWGLCGLWSRLPRRG
jgi:hypothetical protein